MINIDDKLEKLANTLARSDESSIDSTVTKIFNVAKNTTVFKVQEVWYSTIIGKGTVLKGQSDLEILFVLSAKKELENEKVNLELEKTFRKISDMTPTMIGNAIRIKVSGLTTDILLLRREEISKDIQTTLKSLARSVEHVKLYIPTAKLLKYWKGMLDPKVNFIRNFDMEVILAEVFVQKQPKHISGGLKAFFEYVVETKLDKPINFPIGNKPLIQKLTIENKKQFIEGAQYALTLMKKSSPDLSFIGIKET